MKLTKRRTSNSRSLRTLSRMCHEQFTDPPFRVARKTERGKHALSPTLISPMTTGQPQMDTSPPSILSDFRYWSRGRRLYAVRSPFLRSGRMDPFSYFEISAFRDQRGKGRTYFHNGRMPRAMGNLTNFLRSVLSPAKTEKTAEIRISEKGVCRNDP